MDNGSNTSMHIMKKAINAVRYFLNSHVFDGEAKEKINELKSALDSFKGDPVVQEILAALPALEYLIPIFKSGLAIKDRFYLKK